jgi:hypothetical protein
MNWFKKAQFNHAPIAIVSYNSYGELGISFNGGKKYIYPDVSPFYKEKIEKLLKFKNYKAAQKLLSNLSTNRSDSEEEKQQMLSELPSQKELWGDDELV